ncbi:Acyl-CoA-dependent ceramide synthase [Geosmithia morbida]|uniref:Acyl-CoA-dependent ceramide synthase n=1 Tax=Geosmithia morbida TaxID=1094350 RepID=A0A9P4YWT1_9HYPO|nr:Acyl-CoA-dependent ceramide synthase [Geosmithia morbida]KAF4123146.1 Acyl-CoA-dependent ceramide synthase [Geosmithia morbida]
MSEPFPLLNTSTDPLHSGTQPLKRRPRKSSALRTSDIRAGDTGGAMATSKASLEAYENQVRVPPRDWTPAPASPPPPPFFSTCGCQTNVLHSVRQHSGANGKSVNGNASSKKRHGRRRRGLMSRARHIIVKHTFVLPLIIVLAILAAYAVNPTPSNPVHHFIFLSYEHLDQLDASGEVQYGKGPWDIAFVTFYTVVLSFTREFIMQEMLRPLARLAGLPKSKHARFMEQGYTAVYFSVLGPCGLYVMSRTPVGYFNTRGMYENFPHRTHAGVVKFYYLFQAAYWLQQAIVLVLGMEKPRKDFKELVGHHVVSLALIGLSYRFHFTYIGLAVYTTHDISDFFLATSKVLNYIDHPITAPFFGLFMMVWIYMRHYINLRIIWSLFTEFQTVGPFELNWETQQYKCRLSQVITSSLLISLQCLNLFWLFYIIRIAYRIVALNVAEDDRSDDDEEEEEEEVDEKQQLLSEEKAAAAAAAGQDN